MHIMDTNGYVLTFPLYYYWSYYAFKLSNRQHLVLDTPPSQFSYPDLIWFDLIVLFSLFIWFDLIWFVYFICLFILFILFSVFDNTKVYLSSSSRKCWQTLSAWTWRKRRHVSAYWLMSLCVWVLCVCDVTEKRSCGYKGGEGKER